VNKRRSFKDTAAGVSPQLAVHSIRSLCERLAQVGDERIC
jgi:hypothetical protein